MHDGIIQMQLCHLRFNGRYPLFDRAEVVLDLSDITPNRPQVIKDQVFNILSHGSDSGLRSANDSSVFCESKAKGAGGGAGGEARRKLSQFVEAASVIPA
jgi:hypothetical protein